MMRVSPEQQVRGWLQQQGVGKVTLTRLPGYTNYVFRVQEAGKPHPSIVRLANRTLGVGLCPLAHQTAQVIRLHEDAAQLGLAPALMTADPLAGVIWLEIAGERRAIEEPDMPAIRRLLDRLHQSGLNWLPEGGALDVASLGHLQSLAESPADPAVQAVAGQLLRLGQERGYADYPLVPVHSDLNPGNCLHDGQRWWLIDWDFAGMRVAEWDYASLIVENGWDKGQAARLSARLDARDLAWFCANFALLSWAWHVQRGTEASVVGGKRQQVGYWMQQTRLGWS